MTPDEFWKLKFPKMVDEAGVCEFAEAYACHVTASLQSRLDNLWSAHNHLEKQVASITKERDELKKELNTSSEGIEALLRNRAEEAEARVESLTQESETFKSYGCEWTAERGQLELRVERLEKALRDIREIADLLNGDSFNNCQKIVEIARKALQEGK